MWQMGCAEQLRRHLPVGADHGPERRERDLIPDADHFQVATAVRCWVEHVDRSHGCVACLLEPEDEVDPKQRD